MGVQAYPFSGCAVRLLATCCSFSFFPPARSGLRALAFFETSQTDPCLLFWFLAPRVSVSPLFFFFGPWEKLDSCVGLFALLTLVLSKKGHLLSLVFFVFLCPLNPVNGLFLLASFYSPPKGSWIEGHRLSFLPSRLKSLMGRRIPPDSPFSTFLGVKVLFFALICPFTFP